MSRKGIIITSPAGKVSAAFKITFQFYAFECCVSFRCRSPLANTNSGLEDGIELKTTKYSF